MEEAAMPWTQTARDKRALEEELHNELKLARQELACAQDDDRPAALKRFTAALQAFNHD